ncbi:hypothetical protein KPL71_019882 [Citrus sinensis]|uniref:Uncharacterized protein n=1 Tax=Citrus sinensis TaxID=2711 RepID=A0ACB8J2L6_CITSI|nr:hypothetical protein KPL71_019882 [Citrus sinensis]
MANPGVGNKFVSVNLNKSYGQSYHQHQNNHHHNLSHSGYYGSNRARPTGGGGGGMLVLSRPRSSQKAAVPKLSVPPPLNLPSLRKEHERFDSSGSNGGPAGGGVSGAGQRPGSSGTGWTKPGTAVGSDQKINDKVDQGPHSVDGLSKGNDGVGVYVPPSVRSGTVGPALSSFPPAEKASVLRGEDFPSLQAALPAASGSEKKQKDGFSQKQKQGMSEELGNNEQKDGCRFNAVNDGMRPRLQSGQDVVGSGLRENGGINHDTGSARRSEQVRKQEEYFPGPLPLVRLKPRSDWADDERDTGHGITDRDRDHGFSKSEAYWEGDFDMPRPSVLPHKPAHNVFERWGQRDSETGKVSSSEVARVDPFGRDIRAPSREGREGNMWRASSSLQKDGFGALDIGDNRNGICERPSSLNREANKETKFMSSPFRDTVQDDSGRRDIDYGPGGRQPWNNSVHSFNSQRAERNPWERYGSEQYNRFRGDAFQRSSASKSSFSSGGRGFPHNDPMHNFSRDKRPLLKREEPYQDDPFMKDFGSSSFDGRDPFSAGLVGVVKKKKDVLKQTDFHDPVRESFEAELERVQKMQEQERQRIIEEQERALELARREEEERLRVAREQEEQRRRLEEETREAVWRAEQEQLEATRKAEEQRIAREEERQRIIMEEERRKHAAKQKLLELEERIAKRQAEAAKSDSNSSDIADEKSSGLAKERDLPKMADVGDWEDGERMVERITTSASSDSSGLHRSFDMSSRNQFARDNSSGFLDRGKPFNSWRRDAFESGNSSTFITQDAENGHYSPRRDSAFGGRAVPRKEFYGGPGIMSSRNYYKAGILEPHMDEFTVSRGQRWNMSGDGDHYGRNIEMESDFHENITERYGDVGWGQGRYRGNVHPPYPDRIYPNPETDVISSFGRSRYSMRHPRVLPPPTLTSMQKPSYRRENECPSPSTFQENEVEYNRLLRSESISLAGLDRSEQHNLAQPEIIDVQPESTENEEQNLERSTTSRCDSQSSLSVSSAPDSPVHLSHDDLDVSGDSPALSAAEEDKDAVLSGPVNDTVVLPMDSGNGNMIAPASSISAGDDEEWAVENDERLHEQEEYDEDEDGYQEEDVPEGDDENIELTQEFEGIHLEEKGSPHMMSNLVLGFNEGVEVPMPNDDFERSPQNEDTTLAPQISAGTVVEDQGSLDGLCGNLASVDIPSQLSIGSSSGILQETDKAIQDLVVQQDNTQLSAASELMDHLNANSCSVVSTQHPIPTSVGMALQSSSDQSVMSTVTVGLSQAETPVKLQFGLFSGPSLIPSPFPAIQIGSIQMPLLHPQVGTSLAHMHPSQPPVFQFGQLRYTSPVSQGVLPLAPHSVPYVQPNVPANFSLNQNAGVSQPIQHVQQTSTHKSDTFSLSGDNHLGLVRRHLDQGNALNEASSLPAIGSAQTTSMVQQDGAEISLIDDNKTRPDSVFEADEQGHHNLDMRNFKSLNPKKSSGRLHAEASSFQSNSREKSLTGSKAQGLTSGSRGKRYVVTARNNSFPKSSFVAAEPSRSDAVGFPRRPRRQRTEFRVRENADKRQSTAMAPANHLGVDDNSNSSRRVTGISTRSGYRRVVLSKSSKQINDSESSNSATMNSQERDPGSKVGKGVGNESLMKGQNISHTDEGNLKRTIRSEDDVDASLQSGVVRVFEQPGIEAPSDEDDFIEVRSKRQMLNDRREQKEKEIKAKSRLPKKHHSTSQNAIVLTSSNKISASTCGQGANNVRSDFAANEGRNLTNIEVSTGFNANKVSQPLAPIGTPAAKSDPQADLRSQTNKSLKNSSIPVVSGCGKNLASGFIFDSENKIMDNVQTSMGSWGNSRLNQQVMTFTQTQLDEAMNPGKFDSCVSVKDHTSSVSEPNMPSSSILTKDKSFSSSASPINSLLAGEKIQFGAVTSPTVLPPSTRAVSHGIGPPGPCRSDIQISHNLSTPENDCTIFFDKEKNTSESCVNLEDCEAEAEAAASAIAVAAISSDEVVGNGLGTGSVSASETKNFGGADTDGIRAGGDADQQSASQSRAEESLSVALPADLSVETPPISLWPPLPSPPSSNQMISHFPGGLPSHFPLYEMNPLLGGPIFTFGPHEESVPAQSQTQKTASTPGSSSLGTWQQCHSGVDSFYGPPAGYTGPFISPTGGIPGVQGPPHMVVYNHFAPVGQFGQVGLSFMGTYIPSAKQPDWKRNPASSAMGGGEGDVNNLNMVAAQRNPTNLPAPIQHLAPGSPLLPLASPLAMFDVSPFQPPSDMSVQARWSHVPAPPLQSVPMSMPLQRPTDGVLPSQFNHGTSADQSSASNRFPESRNSTPSDSSRNFHAATDATVTQLPEELGLVHASSSTCAGASTQSSVVKSLSVSTAADAGKTDTVQNGSSVGQNTSSTFKPQPSQQKNTSSQQYNSLSGYNYQRGSGVSQKNSSGGEWSHRRMGFHGRNQSFGAEKGFSPSKMKQIYVAKQTPSGTSTAPQ